MALSFTEINALFVAWKKKIYFQVRKAFMHWLTLLIKLDLIAVIFLAKNGRTNVNYSLGADKCTTFLTCNLSSDVLMKKSVKLIG